MDMTKDTNPKHRPHIKVGKDVVAEWQINAGLRWFGHVKRGDQDYIGIKTLEKKKRNTEETDGLCQHRHDSHRNDER